MQKSGTIQVNGDKVSEAAQSEWAEKLLMEADVVATNVIKELQDGMDIGLADLNISITV